MRLIFAGTPEFAARALSALLDSTHEVVLVLSQPDRPAGRGMRLLESPVKRLARARGFTVLQPPSLKDAAQLGPLFGAQADAWVVAAYGLILPPAVLDSTPNGAINIHASLLPRWRGAAPIQRALLAGDRETGVTIMKMDAGLDTGPIYTQRSIPIGEEDDAGSLHDRLANLGAEMIVSALDDIAAGRAHWRAQPAEGANYAHKLDKEEATVDWSRPATELERKLRAFSPSPGALAKLRGEGLKLWHASIDASARGLPGTVLAADDRGIVVACGDGALRVTELQRAGGRRLAAGEFLRGFPIRPGERFGADSCA